MMGNLRSFQQKEVTTVWAKQNNYSIIGPTVERYYRDGRETEITSRNTSRKYAFRLQAIECVSHKSNV